MSMIASLKSPSGSLVLSNLPKTYLLKTRLEPDRYTTLLEDLCRCHVPLADSPSRASLFIGNVSTAKRAEFELRSNGLVLIPAEEANDTAPAPSANKIQFVKLAWFIDCLEQNQTLKIEDYSIYTGYASSGETAVKRAHSPSPVIPESPDPKYLSKGILERALEDKGKREPARKYAAKRRRKELQQRSTKGKRGEQGEAKELLYITKPTPQIRRQSTSDYEAELKISHRPVPEWVRTKNSYSCCRSTPRDSPNEAFISQLKTIRLSRVLVSDDIGVRSYSTAIAAVKAYPYELQTASEIDSLPGCDGKLAALFHEWKNSHEDAKERKIAVVKELEESAVFKSLSTFNSIWGVGPDTARKFYYEKNFRTIDDIVEYHWDNLSRVQQIGIKYYDEIEQDIPRDEMEEIAAIITKNARRVFSAVETILVGGYRRGKRACGDVDLLVSSKSSAFPPEEFLFNLLLRLEGKQLITHTLYVSKPPESDGPHKSSFDHLEKALVIWKSPNGLHRRVDIILAPARCAGTAFISWTGGTTWERDLRLYCKHEHWWKFSSEGVVSRGNGARVLGMEGWNEGEDWVDIEKRVLKVIGVEWRPPTERCTA